MDDCNSYTGRCPLKVNMGPDQISDDHITASSYQDFDHLPSLARYDNTSFWMANKSDTLPWLQVAFHEMLIFSVVALEVPGSIEDGWVQTFRLEYSGDGNTWKEYKNLDTGENVRFLII